MQIFLLKGGLAVQELLEILVNHADDPTLEELTQMLCKNFEIEDPGDSTSSKERFT